MKYTPFEESLAQINGLPVDLQKQPASDFAQYVFKLLENPSPRGGMFARQDEIDRLNQLDLTKALDKKKLEEELSTIIKEASDGMLGGSPFNSDGGDGPSPSPNTGQGPIGVGAATDAIQEQALQDAMVGLVTGGIPGAIQSGIQSMVTGTLGLLGQVNNTQDPLGTWAVLQQHAPVPVVSYNAQVTNPTGVVASPVTTTSLPAVVDLGTLANPTPAAVDLGIVGGGTFGGVGGVNGSGVSPGGGNAAGGFGVGGW